MSCILDLAVIFFICLVLSMPLSLLLLAAFWVITRIVGEGVFHADFGMYMLITLILATMMWGTWMIDMKGEKHVDLS